MKLKETLLYRFCGAVAFVGVLSSTAMADDLNIPLDVYNFNPEAQPVKGSAVSEFEWAINAVDDICQSDSLDDYMQPICDEIAKIRADLNDDYYMSFYNQDIPTTLTELQKGDAFDIAGRLQHVFGQVSDTVESCDFDKDMQCYKMYFESTAEYKTFAFPFQPA